MLRGSAGRLYLCANIRSYARAYECADQFADVSALACALQEPEPCAHGASIVHAFARTDARTVGHAETVNPADVSPLVAAQPHPDVDADAHTNPAAYLLPDPSSDSDANSGTIAHANDFAKADRPSDA